MPKHCSIYVFHPNYEPHPFSFFDIGTEKPYLTESIIPFSKSPLSLSMTKDSSLKVTCYFSGSYLQGLEKMEINLIKKLVQGNRIELLSGTYTHSLSSLISNDLFKEEVKAHKSLVKGLFQIEPSGFINTICIFSNDLIDFLKKERIDYCIAPRLEWFLGKDVSARVVLAKDEKLKLLLAGDSTHDRAITVSYLSGSGTRFQDLKTITGREAVDEFLTVRKYNVPGTVALNADGRDLTHHIGNSLQKQYFKQLTQLAPIVEKRKNEGLKKHLLLLSNPSILELMNSEHTSRYDSYTCLMNCLTDLEIKLQKLQTP